MTIPTLPAPTHVRGEGRRNVPVHVRLTGDEDVAVGTMTVTAQFRGRLHHKANHLVLWAHTGTVHISGPDVHGPLWEGVPTVLMAGREYAVEATPARLSIIRISDTYLRQAITHTGASSPATTDSAQIRVALRSIVPALLEPPGTRHGGLREQVADAVAATFQAGTQSLPSASTRTSERFGRALIYLHEHAREPVGVAEVAVAVGLTTRGVQQLFQREIGRTPTEVLRTARLEGARADIQEAGPDRLVGDIARSWQFRHLGRFANLYRQTYGETPSETLRHRHRHRHANAVQ